MASETAKALLRTSIGFITVPTDIDALLTHDLDAAASRLAKDGVPINEADPDDLDLLVMYARWLYRKRSSGEPMEPMLRYAINNGKIHKAVTSDA